MSSQCNLGFELNEPCEGGSNIAFYIPTKEEKELLHFRTNKIISNLCFNHKMKYITNYSLNQRKCCDPFDKHEGISKMQGLRVITIDMKKRKPLENLIPGKKLCTSCRKMVNEWTQPEQCPSPGSIATETENILDENFDLSSEEDLYENELQHNVSELNDSLLSIGESPIQKRKLSQREYPENKIKKIENQIRRRLKLDETNLKDPHSCKVEQEYTEMLDQLKRKFNESEKRSEKIQVLTVLPMSWSTRKIEMEFQTTYHMARSVKTLVKYKGIMSTPNSRPGKTMNEETVKIVKCFFESDSISRLMPGKKDCVSMKINGHKENVQKRLLLSNLIEAYKQFKTEHPTVKVGFTKFTELRPKNVVLAGASGTHNVFVCTIHQNMKIMIEGSKIATNPDFRKIFDISADTTITTQHLLAKLSCNPALPKCLLGKCSLCALNTNPNRYCGYCQHKPSTTKDTRVCPQCKKVSNFKDDIMEIYEHLNIDEISYKAWVSTDRTSLEILTKKVEDFVNTLVQCLGTLRRHDFIAKQQSAFLNERKQNLQQGEIIVIGDFSENYSFVLQDAVQGFHWTNDQATLHPFVIYYFGKKSKSEKADNDITNDEVLKMRCLSFVIISNCMTHDSVAVHYFIKVLLKFLKSEISVNKAFYFSDGAASQYKNKKNFINLAYHYHDFHIEAEWHFFATSHGKGPCDGVGGTVKRLAARTSLQRPYDNQIQTPQQLFEWAKEAIPSVNFQYVNEEEIKEEGSLLKQRFDSALPITGTQSFHAYYPILNSKTKLQVKLYSNSEIKETVKISSTQELLSIEEIRNYQHVICEYDNQWWLALVIKFFPETDEVEVQFLHPAGPSPSFSFPQKLDKLMVNCCQILMKASPTTQILLLHLLLFLIGNNLWIVVLGLIAFVSMLHQPMEKLWGLFLHSF